MSRRLTVGPSLIEQILELRDQGLTERQIAAEVGRARAIVGRVLRGTHPACRLEGVRSEFRSIGHVVREERDGSLLIRVERKKLEDWKSGRTTKPA